MLGIICSHVGNKKFPRWELLGNRKEGVNISIADYRKVVRGLPASPWRTMRKS